MVDPVLYLPIGTTVLSVVFTVALVRRYSAKGRGAHLLWWAFGVLVYGAGTLAESVTSVFGWHEGVFRAWYICGALLGGAPLAQGTVYLLLRRKTAHVLTAILVAFVAVASTFVLAAPVDADPSGPVAWLIGACGSAPCRRRYGARQALTMEPP